MKKRPSTQIFVIANLIILNVLLTACGGWPGFDSIPTPTLTPAPPTLTVTPSSTPTKTPIPRPEVDGLPFERVTEGGLVDTFPDSDVYMTERGDVVIIHREKNLDIDLAGGKFQTKYGDLTVLFTPGFYQELMTVLLPPEILEARRNSLSSIDPLRKRTEYLQSLAAYNNMSADLVGYPDMAEWGDSFMRIIRILDELKVGVIKPGEKDLTTYDPLPTEATPFNPFIVIFASKNQIGRVINTLPEGLLSYSLRSWWGSRGMGEVEGSAVSRVVKDPNETEIQVATHSGMMTMNERGFESNYGADWFAYFFDMYTFSNSFSGLMGEMVDTTGDRQNFSLEKGLKKAPGFQGLYDNYIFPPTAPWPEYYNPNFVFRIRELNTAYFNNLQP